MAALNKVQLIGNLTRDPELRVTPTGKSVCKFGIAVSRKFKDEAGNTREDTTFVELEAWGKRGETIAKHTGSGQLLYLEGRLKLDQWEDKASKQKRSRMKVILENFQFLGARPGSAGDDSPETREDDESEDYGDDSP
ncbi:single-stranded DNA-binding protein (plasmid) [Opitutaceae bacterium TAV5]|nr:single-stranded DNA-binding protein [Opitutaceae bacterium TAV5]